MLACMATYSLDDVREVCKKRDAWWTVLLVDPLAVRLTRLLANWTPITPNQLTLASLAAGLGAAGCFATGTPYCLALGALAYHVSFILDCCDGKLARLTGTGTPLGSWLNHIADRTRALCCALALIGGQYLRTGRVELFYLGFIVLVLDMFRSLNTFHAARTRQAIRDRLDIAAELAGAAEPTENAGPLLPSQDERLRYVEELYRPLRRPGVPRLGRCPADRPSASPGPVSLGLGTSARTAGPLRAHPGGEQGGVPDSAVRRRPDHRHDRSDRDDGGRAAAGVRADRHLPDLDVDPRM
jgi:Phosphatidylglycerophosphate synthase